VSTPRPGLAELRRRACETHDAAASRALAAALRADARAGARALADAIERRLSRDEDEARRQDALYARTDALRAAGLRAVAGVDEVGMGPLAGPVVAAAVILPARADLPGLDDSKRLDPRARERLAAAIRSQAVAFAVAEVDPAEVDRLNVHRAGLEAMRRAVLALAAPPDHVLVDARTIPGLTVPQSAIVCGDAREAPIAAASIVAKVHRDALMCRLDAAHPGYGFARHKGYPTAEHLEALRRLGPCGLHRRSFAPVTALS
jgi:ribonuclease HII